MKFVEDTGDNYLILKNGFMEGQPPNGEITWVRKETHKDCIPSCKQRNRNRRAFFCTECICFLGRGFSVTLEQDLPAKVSHWPHQKNCECNVQIKILMGHK